MTNLTIKTGTEEDFFKRGRQLAKAADRGEQLPDERIISFEGPADMMKQRSVPSLTDEAFDAANRRAADKKAAFPAVVAVRYDRRVSRIVITLTSGLELAFSPKHAPGLEHARPADLADPEITPSGLGVHFPKLDADLYIPALLENFLGLKR